MKKPLYSWRWHRALKELSLVIRPEAFRELPGPPPMLFQELAENMKAREASGEIERHEAHRLRIPRCWEVGARQLPTQEVVLVAARGQPHLPKDIVIERPLFGADRVAALLTLGTDWARLAKIRPEWIGVFARAEMRRLDLPGTPHEGEIFAAWSRVVLHRERIVQWPIPPRPLEDRHPEMGPWRVHADDATLRVDLILEAPLTDPRALLREAMPKLKTLLARAADRDGACGFCRIFRRHLFRSLRAAAQSPAALGLGLPVRIPAGIALRDLEGHTTRLATMVTSVLAYERLSDAKLRATADGFAFYPDERRKTEEHMMHAGVGRARGDGTMRLLPEVSLATTAAGSAWSRRVHNEALIVGRAAISGVSEKLRDLQAVTIGLHEGRVAEIVELLRGLRRDAINIATKEPSPDSVYYLATEFFPLTRFDGSDSKSRSLRPKTADHAHWIMLVLRELLSLDLPDQSPAALSSRLIPHVSPVAIESSIAKLEKGKFIAFDPLDQCYRPTAANIFTGQDGGGASLARYHEDMIDLTAAALSDPDRDRSQFRGTVLAIRRETLPQFRAVFLGAFQKLIAICGTSPRPDQLYQLNIRLVPLIGTRPFRDSV